MSPGLRHILDRSSQTHELIGPLPPANVVHQPPNVPVHLQARVQADVVHYDPARAAVAQDHAHPCTQGLPDERHHASAVDGRVQQDLRDVAPVDGDLQAMPTPPATASHGDVNLIVRDAHVLEGRAGPRGEGVQRRVVPDGGGEAGEAEPEHGHAGDRDEEGRAGMPGEGVGLDPHPHRGEGPTEVFLRVSPPVVECYHRRRRR
jgi:hypothetical protein